MADPSSTLPIVQELDNTLNAARVAGVRNAIYSTYVVQYD